MNEFSKYIPYPVVN